MRDAFWLAVGLAAAPDWLTWALTLCAIAAVAAVVWAVVWQPLADLRRTRTPCACGTAQRARRTGRRTGGTP